MTLFHTHIHKYAIMQIISKYWLLFSMYLHNYCLTQSSTYMKKVNDVTGWLSQTTDISKYFVWSPGLWDKECRLYIAPGQGLTTPGDKILLSTEISCHFSHLLLVAIIDDNSYWKIHCFTFFPYKSLRDQKTLRPWLSLHILFSYYHDFIFWGSPTA